MTAAHSLPFSFFSSSHSPLHPISLGPRIVKLSPVDLALGEVAVGQAVDFESLVPGGRTVRGVAVLTSVGDLGLEAHFRAVHSGELHRGGRLHHHYSVEYSSLVFFP